MSPRLCTAPAVCCSSSFFFLLFFLSLLYAASVLCYSVFFFVCVFVCFLSGSMLSQLYAGLGLCCPGSVLLRLCAASALFPAAQCCPGSLLSWLFIAQVLPCPRLHIVPALCCPDMYCPGSLLRQLFKKKKKKNYRDSVLSRLCVTFFCFVLILPMLPRF